MKTIIQKMLVASLCIMGSLVVFAKGESYKKADSLSAGKSKTVTLVNEVDDENEYTDSGCYYIKVICSRDKEYTIYLSGATGDAALYGVNDISSYDLDKEVNLPSFSSEYDNYYTLTLEDWDDDGWDDAYDKSGTFYICLTGEIGDTATVTFASGIVDPPIQYGTEENPKAITVGNNTSTASASLIDGAYYFTVNLTAGSRYTFKTVGGTEDESLTMDISTNGEDMEDPIIKDLDLENNGGCTVIPQSTGSYLIKVDGFGTQSFTLSYGKTPSRLPMAHEFIDLGAPTASGVEEDIELGYRNDPECGYYDDVIDEQLVKVTLAAGTMYHFATRGSTVNAVMELYDAKGNKLATNTNDLDGCDCALTYKVTTKGDYYVGVCEALELDENGDEVEPTGCTVTLTAKIVTVKDGFADADDPTDDEATGATGLAPAIGTSVSDVLTAGSTSAEHTLGVGDLVDWFRIDARKGLGYKVAAEVLEKPAKDYTLQATVYTRNGTKMTEFAVIENLEEGDSFTAAADTSYYIEVTLKDAQGIDFGPYVMKSLAYSTTGAELGILRVEIGGATFAEGATWNLNKETVKYPGGSSVMLPAGSYTVNFATVKNWTAPKAQTVEVKAGSEETLVDVKYSDTSDPKDDTLKGATKITPASKVATVSRSLWADDVADWYSFAVKVNSYYTFALESSSKLGDATIVIYAADGETVIAEGTEIEFLCREAKGNYYVCVKHANEVAIDSQYTMTYTTKQVGAVGFAKTAVSVKDSATSVALTVNRANGREGKVRVRYSTFAGTAEPGENYFPQSGVLEWAENDTKAKTLTIDLIGDLVAAWKEDIEFYVRLDAIEPGAVGADEMVPVLGATEATVTISAATKKSTGTIQFAGFGAENEAFANAKKPTATVKAGETATFWLERVGGSDGKVAVTVTPKKGKAMPDVNYVEEVSTLVWEDGDAEPQCVELETLVEEDTAYQATKSLTLALAVDKTVSSETVKLGTAVTLNITDAELTQTVEEYAATFTKADGVTVKAGKTDTWYFDAAGTLRSVTPTAGNKAELTLTLVGPGKVAFTPNFVNSGSEKNTATCTIGKETINLAETDDEVVRYLGKGNTTVKFSISRDRADKDADADVYLTLDGGNGQPFAWKQLASPQLVTPRAGELVDANDSDSHIVWTDVDATGDGDVLYRVWFVPEKQKATIGKGEPVAEDADTSFCPNCSTTTPEPGETWICRVDSMLIDEDGEVRLVNTNTTTWTYKTYAEGAVVPRLTAGVTSDGEEIAALEKEEGAYPVTLMQGTPARITLGADSEETLAYSLVSGSKLPDGLKLDTKTGVISGTPTKVGDYTTIIQVKSGKTMGGTISFLFDIESCGLASGTFNGLVLADDDEDRLLYDEDAQWTGFAAAQIGSVTVTSTDAGKLTAKVIVGGSTYSFSGTSWGGKTVLDNGLAGVTNTLISISKFTVNRQNIVCTNTLTLAACAEGTNEWEAVDTPMELELTMSFLSSDKKSVLTNVVYSGEAYRDNSKYSFVLDEMADFVGYYTVSLAPTDYEECIQGYGYLTVTLDAKGKAKVAGVLADGTTKISASATAIYVSDSLEGEREVSIPLYYGKGTAAFGGWLELRLDEDGTPIVSSDSELIWINAATTANYTGDAGFSIEIEPVGGYYNTIVNLQTYYLNYAFYVSLDDELPDELLGSNEAYVCYPGLYLDYLNLAGQNITVDKTVKTMRTDNKKLIDWEETINPSGLTMTFKRATGIYNGQFDIYAGDADAGEETKQTKLGSYKHQGVLLLSRDETTGSLNFDDCAMPGFWNAALTIKDEETNKTRKFTASLPFLIIPEAIDYDWSEGFVDTTLDDDDEEDEDEL